MSLPSICIAGLGNPGAEYVSTRHNAGRIFLELFLQLGKSSGTERLEDCDVCTLKHRGLSIALAAPRAYMNESGPPLARLVRSLKIPMERFLVCHDDVDLPLGRVQLKRGGSAAGHRGVESLYQAIGSSEFYRLRIGVGRNNMSTRDYVLSNFEPADRQALSETFTRSIGGLEFWIRGDPDKAAQELNTEPAKS